MPALRRFLTPTSPGVETEQSERPEEPRYELEVSSGRVTMLIHEMNYDECVSVLARLKFGRLACVRDNQPYVVPIYFAFHERHLYTFSKSGQKIEWMRGNPLVCVEVDEITSSYQWLSVVVLGRYEELPDTPEYKFDRNLAHDMLAERAMWWQPAYVASTHRSAADSLSPVYYRIRMDQVTGHRGMPNAIESESLSAPEPAIKHESRLLNLLSSRTAHLNGNNKTS